MTGVTPSADGVPVHFGVEGTGAPALVFVHGWSCDRTYWRGQLGHFAARHEVVAIDLAGHGQSGIDRRTWTMAAFGEDVAAVARRLELADVVLVGHSMGGDVIVEAALRLVGRVRGLVWVDTYATLGTPRTPAEIEELVRPLEQDFVPATRRFVGEMFVPGSDPELVEWVAADMSAAPREIALDALRHAVGNEAAVVEGLRALDARVVAINPSLRPTDVEALRRHGVEAVLMPGVAHFLMLEDPDGFNRLLARVVAGFAASPGGE
jgi:pimeloyl-ACP methyl ester carboxylesterase